MAWTKQMPASPVVAVCGATGAVGQEFLTVLHDLDFPAAQVKALASVRSAGKKIAFGGCGNQPAGDLTVEEMTPESFTGVDIALFSAGSNVSKQLRDAVTAAGAVMIDNSSAFRMDAGVPLVIPEVNPQDAYQHEGVIANPNCSTIEMAVALAPLSRVAPIKRVVVSTYQAASGAGLPAMHELREQTRQMLAGEEPQAQEFAHPLAFNCIPRIDVMREDGYSKEEWKMIAETRKIMHAPEIGITATCVRVPVMRCHGESLNVEFATPISLDEAYAAWEAAPGIEILDQPDEDIYPMPGALAGTDPVYVGRVRCDATVKNGLAFWLVMDQIRKGAALNAVQIAQLLLP